MKEPVTPTPDGLPDDTLVSPMAEVTTPDGRARAPLAAPVAVIGQELGPVRLLDELGKGAMGVVFLGHHKLLDRKVAVKFLIGAPEAPGEPYSAQFIAEAKAAAAVHHPHLTQIYHADTTGTTPYLVMEYINGPSLAQLLRRTGKLSPVPMLAVMTEVTSAVSKLHDHNIVHRDLKPSNVLLDREGRSAVCDFGLAVRGRTGAADSLLCAGTPGYMAPEMFEGRVSFRSDIYALGIMMYQLLAGTAPFIGALEEIRQQHYHNPLPLDVLRTADVDDRLIEILERATHKQAMFRYKTAHELNRAIRALGTDTVKGRRELERMITSTKSDVPTPAEGGAPGSSKTPGRGSSGDLLAGALEAKRQRRFSTVQIEVALPAPPPIVPVPVIALPPEAAVEPELTTEPPVSVRPCPGNLKGICILGIILASIGCVAVVVQILIQLASIKPAWNAPRSFHIYGWASIAVNFILVCLLMTGSMAAMRLKRWARKALLAYAILEPIYQLVTVGVCIAVSIPRFTHHLRAHTKSQSEAEAIQQFGMIRVVMSSFVLIAGLAVIAFAIGLIAVLLRPRVRLALNPLASENSLE